MLAGITNTGFEYVDKNYRQIGTVEIAVQCVWSFTSRVELVLQMH